MRPCLAACSEFRISSLRVVIPGRQGYEKDLLRSLGDDLPEQVRPSVWKRPLARSKDKSLESTVTFHCVHLTRRTVEQRTAAEFLVVYVR